MARSALLPLTAALVALAGVPAGAQVALPATGTAITENAFCAGLGAKRPGSPADAAMAEHIADRFRAAGLETSTETFHMPSFEVEGVTLQAVGGATFPATTFAYGGAGDVTAGVVDVGTGRSTDYAGKDAKGKIVIVDRNEAFHRTSQLQQIVAHGGVGMLYVSASPSNLVQIGAVRFAQQQPATIPTVTIGADDGDRVRALLAAHPEQRFRLNVAAERKDVVGRNVIGVQRGTTWPDRYVVVAGHFDSWFDGAVDNCSGVGSLLEIAEGMKAVKPAYTVLYMAWDAEEEGLVGSTVWVQRHPDLVERIVVDENLEMTSAATYLQDQRLDLSAENLVFGTLSPAMNGLIYESASRNGYFPAPTTAAGVRAISGGIIPTDLEPFYAAGVQGFSTFSSAPYYHTTEDKPDKIDPASYERTTSMLLGVARDVQSIPPESLALREVPTVHVAAPASAKPGEALPLQITVTDPAGRPVTGVLVHVLADQRDNWAVAEGNATESGGGVYRYTVPAGVTEADLTQITATVQGQSAYIAEGYARVDQRRGGVLAPARACRSQRRIVVHLLHGARLVRAKATLGRVVARRGARRLVLDLRGARRGTVRLRIVARTMGGSLRRQVRTYHTCVPGH